MALSNHPSVLSFKPGSPNLESSIDVFYAYNQLTFESLDADPIFSFSPLAIHTRNLLADPRCTLVVQVPPLFFSHFIMFIFVSSHL